eukprot:tig00021017_g17210.t1
MQAVRRSIVEKITAPCNHYLNILLGHWRHFTICGHRHCWTPSTRSTTQRFALMKSAPRIRLPSLMFRSIIPKHLTGDPSAVANEAVKVLLILDSNPYFLMTFSETMENAAPVSTNAMMDSAASLTRTVTLACTPRRRWTLRMAAAVSLSRSSLDARCKSRSSRPLRPLTPCSARSLLAELARQAESTGDRSPLGWLSPSTTDQEHLQSAPRAEHCFRASPWQLHPQGASWKSPLWLLCPPDAATTLSLRPPCAAPGWPGHSPSGHASDRAQLHWTDSPSCRLFFTHDSTASNSPSSVSRIIRPDTYAAILATDRFAALAAVLAVAFRH